MSDEPRPNTPGGTVPTPGAALEDVLNPDDISRTPGLARLSELELFERLGWFIKLRWLAGAAALLLMLVARHVFDVRIPQAPVAGTIFALFLCNALFLLLVTDAYRRRRVSHRFIVGCANAQIFCDLVILATLMHFTGGVENPYLVFFVTVLVIASELLPAWNAYLHAAFGAALINAVAWFELSGALPHVCVMEPGADFYRDSLMVIKASVALTLLAFVTVFLGSSIAMRLRRREAELEDAFVQLRELDRSKSFLMRQTSHDLRSPLNALITILRVVASESVGQVEPRLLDFIRRAEQRALGLSHLIDELHRYAVLRESVAGMESQRLDLAATIGETVQLYRLMAEEKGVHLTSDIAPLHVTGNPQMLRELVGNLLANAIQYTPPDGKIHVHLSQGDHTAKLEISDTGIGIPPESLVKVFDEFYRTSQAKEVFHSGTGMGLPIVKRIAEAHNGTINVRSQVGEGTTFTLTLPLT
ncbi:MAG: HAMP domain-containing histidine kinase [Phycisphaerae bacterium]|nr:HAMP domain-containing histidine kinase [Phycisphaerae bacterium]